MHTKKIKVTPPALFNNANTYLQFISKLLKDKNIAVDLIQSIPLLVKNNTPAEVLGEGISYPQSFIHEKMIAVHEENIMKVLDYLALQGISTGYSINVHEDPNRIHSGKQDLNDALLWTVEVSSNYNLWNEIFGTVETELAKDIDIPCLCIPSDYIYKKPETLLIFCQNYNSIVDHIPITILNEFNIKPILICEDQQISDHSIKASLNLLPLHNRADFIRFSDFDDEVAIKSMIDKINPTWIAYKNFDKGLFDRPFTFNTNQCILESDRPILIL